MTNRADLRALFYAAAQKGLRYISNPASEL